MSLSGIKTLSHTGGTTSSTSTAFGIIQPDSGTSPTAATAADTLTLHSANAALTVVGNSGTKTVTLTVDATQIVKQTITNGVTTTAPSENAVFAALALKASTTHAATHNSTGTDPLSLTQVLKPLTQVYVDAANYATVQAAVNYAETLSAADDAVYGCIVIVPAGNYNETVTIKRNVSLVAEAPYNTKITTIVIRARTNAAGPSIVNLKNLYIGTVTVTNETGPSSGVFWSGAVTMLGSGLYMNYCEAQNMTVTNVAGTIWMRGCRIGGGGGSSVTYTNVGIVEYDMCEVNDCLFKTDTTDVNSQTGFSALLYIHNSFSYATTTLTRTAGTTNPSLYGKQSYLSTVVSNANTTLDLIGCSCDSVTKSGTTSTFASRQSYTPATAGNWAVASTNVDTALDQLAANSNIQQVVISTAGVASPNVLTSASTNNTIINTGAAAKNYDTLPAPTVGLQFTFYCQNTNGIRVTATAGKTIRLAGSVSGAGGYCESTTTGSSVTLLAINTTEWVATSVVGTWTVT